MNQFELTPKNGQKSFYGKAWTESKRGVETLYSYGTAIIRRNADGRYMRLWDGWTATTGKHIAAFCGMNKKQFLALPLNRYSC